MPETETLYSFRVNKHRSLVIAKWVDGGQRPSDLYTITMAGRGKCDCIGSIRQPYCRHRQMVDYLLSNFPNMSMAGCFFDWDHKILYTPEDGEGIPTTNFFNILHPELDY